MSAPNSGRHYTSADLDVLARNYATRGAKWCAKKLGRSIHSVRSAARNHALGGLTPRGEERATHVAQKAGVSTTAVIKAATRDGVLTRRGENTTGAARIATVPTTWAAEYVANRPPDRWSELRAAGWVTVNEAAEYIGVGPATIHLALRGAGLLAQFLQPARRELVTRTTARLYLIEPHTLDAARDHRAALRNAATLGVTVKELEASTGLAHRTLFDRFEKLGITPTWALAGGVTTLVVTREEAERVKALPRYSGRGRPHAPVTLRPCAECGHTIPREAPSGLLRSPSDYAKLQHCGVDCGRAAANRKRWGVTGSRARVLNLVRQYGGLPLTHADISEELGISTNHASTLTRELASAGLIERSGGNAGVLVSAPVGRRAA